MCLICDGFSEDDVIRGLDLTIRTYGWALTQVDGGRTAWGYTIGLLESYGHPELIVMDLDVGFQPKLMRPLVETIESEGSLDPAELDGLAFSPDESILYVNDSAARCIKSFDVAPGGELSNARVFAKDTGSATKVDRGGHVFCTGKGGVHVLDPYGRFLGRILVPEKCSNLAWGEDRWQTLFVTAGRSIYRVPTTTSGVAVGAAT